MLKSAETSETREATMQYAHTWCLGEQYRAFLQPLHSLSPFHVPHQVQSGAKEKQTKSRTEEEKRILKFESNPSTQFIIPP